MNIKLGTMVAAAALAISAEATMQYGYEWGFSDDNGAYITKTAADAGDLSFTVVDYGMFEFETSSSYYFEYEAFKVETQTASSNRGPGSRPGFGGGSFGPGSQSYTREVATGVEGVIRTNLAAGDDQVTIGGLNVGDRVYIKCVGYYDSEYSFNAADDTYTVGHEWYGEDHTMTITFAKPSTAPVSGQPLPGTMAVLLVAGAMSVAKRRFAKRA